MDPESNARLVALLKKTEAQVLADWKWPVWRRKDDEDRRADEEAVLIRLAERPWPVAARLARDPRAWCCCRSARSSSTVRICRCSSTGSARKSSRVAWRRICAARAGCRSCCPVCRTVPARSRAALPARSRSPRGRSSPWRRRFSTRSSPRGFAASCSPTTRRIRSPGGDGAHPAPRPATPRGSSALCRLCSGASGAARDVEPARHAAAEKPAAGS